jgi:hypothetical protein
MTSWPVARPGAGRLGIVARFFVLGALLLAGRHLLFPAPDARAPLVVEVAAGSDADAVRRAAVDAALVDEAVRAGWPLGDPVVGVRVPEAGESFARGLVAADPVTRARLAWIGRELVKSRTPARAPTAAELAAYRAAHPTRYDPAWLSFRQRVVSNARHGARTDADARALAASLAGLGPDAAGGDPSLLPAHMSGTPAMIDARFGAGFAARVAAAPIGGWYGPVAGTFGEHVVWREPARVPSDDAASGAVAAGDAVAIRVARDWAHDRHAEDVRRAIDQLVARRRVVVREVEQREDGEVTP